MSATTTTTSTTTKNNQVPMIHFAIVDRLRKLALVHQALELANQSYTRIKSSNGLVEATLTQAESVANHLARPLLNTLEQPINLADNLACQSFDKIQSSVSILSKNLGVEMVRKRLEETMEFVQNNTKQVRTLIDQNINQTRDRIQSIRKQTSEHIHSMLNVSATFIRSVDNSLNAAENALDRLLPPSKPEIELISVAAQTEPKTNIDSLRRLFQRMVLFSDKLRRRIWQHAEEKWLLTIQQSAMNFKNNILNIVSSQVSNRLQMNSSKENTSKSKQL